MKQILKSLKTGATEVADAPRPATHAGQLLIRSSTTLVPAGTESTMVDFGRAGWFDMVKSDGLVRNVGPAIDEPGRLLPFGCCNAGRVVDMGRGVSGFQVGDRVVSIGSHAETFSVPVNLCARIPEAVSDDEAAFTVLGGIALQGIRLVQPTLGETVAVLGLGLIGLVAVQLLRAHGCLVIGLDLDPSKLELVRRFGGTAVDLSAGADPVAAAYAATRGRGVDAVVITADCSSNEPLQQAALMCRKRGRVVLVGMTGLEPSRADFHEKELSVQVACPYGPGRYDPSYEELGRDYPVGFVRWTEQRNFEAVLDMMADGRLDVKTLVSHRLAISDAPRAHELVRGSAPSLGILLEYPDHVKRPETSARSLSTRPRHRIDGAVSVGFIGSGGDSTRILIPAFRASGARIKSVAPAGGMTGVRAVRKFGFESITTDSDSILDDPGINAVVISTGLDSDAALVCRALRAGKSVFVEKPLALRQEELAEVQAAFEQARSTPRPPVLVFGFNRRFAPHAQCMHRLLGAVPGPKTFVMTVNSGAISAERRNQVPLARGGIIEKYHIIDLLRFLAGSSIAAAGGAEVDFGSHGTAAIQLCFDDGSIGTIHYLASGARSFPKERLEVFASGRVLQLDDFRKLRGFGWPGFRKMNLWRPDKGEIGCVRAFVDAAAGRSGAPIPFDQLLEVSEATIRVAEQVRAGT